MPKEYDRIPIDEVATEMDHDRHKRCGVCAHPWHGAAGNGGRDHPPPALWLPRGMPGAPDVEPGCHATLPPSALMIKGLILTPCAFRKPAEPPAEDDASYRKLKRFPADVCPVGVTPPPLIPRPPAPEDDWEAWEAANNTANNAIDARIADEFAGRNGNGNGHRRPYAYKWERKGSEIRHPSEGLPFGKTRDENGKVVDHREEQGAIRLIKSLAAQGYGYTAIARELERRGAKCRALKWHPVSLARFIRREGIL